MCFMPVFVEKDDIYREGKTQKSICKIFLQLKSWKAVLIDPLGITQAF